MSSAEIYILLAILGFIILAACLIFLIIAIIKTLNALTQVFNSLEKQIEDLDRGPHKLISQANELSENLNHKMKCLDPLFHSVSNIGDELEYRTAKYKDERLLNYLFEKVNQKEETKVDQALDIAALVLNVLELLQKFKKRR